MKRNRFLSLGSFVIVFCICLCAGVITGANNKVQAADTGKLLYYVELGVGANGDYRRNFGTDNNADLTGSRLTSVTPYDTAAGIKLATAAAPIGEGILYNSHKERSLGTDPNSGKEWGMIRNARTGTGTSDNGPVYIYKNHNQSDSRPHGYKYNRYFENGSDGGHAVGLPNAASTQPEFGYIFEVDNDTTPYRVTLGFSDSWGTRNFNIYINGYLEQEAFQSVQNAVTNYAAENVYGVSGDQIAPYVSGSSGELKSSEGYSPDKYYIKVTVTRYASGSDPWLNRIFVETMDHSTPLFESNPAPSVASNQYVIQGEPKIKVTDSSTTASLAGGDKTLELAQSEIDKINNAMPFAPLSVTGTYGGSSYTTSIRVLPYDIEYFVDCGNNTSTNINNINAAYGGGKLKNTTYDKQWSSGDWGYSSGGGGSHGSAGGMYDVRDRYNQKAAPNTTNNILTYQFTLNNLTSNNPAVRYKVYWGSFLESGWGNRYTTLSANSSKIDDLAMIKGGGNTSFYSESAAFPVQSNPLKLDFSARTQLNLDTASTETLVAYIAIVPCYDVFDADGGALSIPADVAQKITYLGSPNAYAEKYLGVQIGETPAKYSSVTATPPDGLLFDGWVTEQGGSTPADFNAPITAETRFYPKWVPDVSTVTFHANNGTEDTGTQEFSSGVEGNLTGIDVLGFTRENYTFQGWALSKALADVGTVAYANGAEFTADAAEISLFAVWKGVDCTVNLDYQGGEDGDTQTSGQLTVEYGKEISFPEVTKDGHHFVGWFTDETGGTEVEEGTIWNITAATTLYARWVEEGAVVSISVNGQGSVSGSSPDYEYAVGAEITLKAAPAPGYRFVKWTLNGSDTALDAEDSYTIAAGDVGNTLAFVAVFTEKDPIQVSITADDNGSIAGSTDTSGNTYKIGDEITLAATPDTGYSFLKWTLNGSDTALEAEDSYIIKAADIEAGITLDFVAVFTEKAPVQVTVTADVNGSIAGSSASGTYGIGSEITLVATADLGFEFLKWTLNGSDLSVFEYGATATYTVSAADVDAGTPLAFVAEFKSKDPVPVTVTLIGNGRLIGSTGSGTYGTGSEIILNATPDIGYKFVEWTLNGVNFSNNASASYVITGADVEGEATFDFVAVFTEKDPVQVTISAGSNGSVTGSSENGTYGIGSVITLKAVPGMNYEFDAWVKNGGSGSFTNTAETTYTITAEDVEAGTEITFTANFTIKTYTVTFYDDEGGVLQSGQVEHGGTATPPVAAAPDGYSFDAWYDAITDGNKVTDFTNITEALEVWARFTINRYNVEFYNGDDLIDTVVVDHNSAVTPPQLTKDFHVFTGWFTDSGLTTPWNLEDGVTDNLELYAKWNLMMFTITVESEGSQITFIIKYAGETMTGDDTPLREGYTFEGWYENSALTEKYDNTKPISKNMTLYAKWSINEDNETCGTCGSVNILPLLPLWGAMLLVITVAYKKRSAKSKA